MSDIERPDEETIRRELLARICEGLDVDPSVLDEPATLRPTALPL